MFRARDAKNGISSLRERMQDCYGRPRILAVTSGKGGVGKSNIAANLALCFSAAHKKVLLVDADLALGNLDLLLNINPKYNLAHFISGRRDLRDIIHPVNEDLDILPGASGMEDIADITPFQRQKLINQLTELQNDSEVIIIDTAAGISHSVTGFCLAADHVLVISTPEATSMTDAYAMIKLLAAGDFPGRISVLVNMAESNSQGRKVYRQLSRAAGQFLNVNLLCAGVIPRDERLRLAVKMRKPVVLAYPNARITGTFAALTAKLNAEPPVKTENNGFFKKVVEWFA